MGKQTIVPFGPQHPVLPEPIHLDLVLEDEKVVGALPSVGFIHRGLEGLINKRDYKDMVYVVERICGICSFLHGAGYCEAIERVMDIEIPERAKYLRTIWGEMSRVHSHLLWLGLTADAFGFEALFMQCWREREKILDMFDMSTGGRIIFSANTVGGVLKDIDKDMLNTFLMVIDDMEKKIKAITEPFLKDYSVQSRLKEVGILTPEDAIRLGAVGPTLRASGVEYDVRKLGSYGAYKDLDFELITSKNCDCYARVEVRIAEIFQSFNIIRQAAAKIPDTEIAVPVKGNPNGEAIVRIEQPRGEAFYYVKANGTKFLERCRVRTPTFTNLMPMISILPGADLADVPLLILTIDPCISCTER